ncbi:MAG TPA: HPP family protein [Actinomycetota bacterium]|nr:HPP family protein [Actinomycetota bacterium]
MSVEGQQHDGLQGRLAGRFGPGGGAVYGFAGCAIGIAVCGLAAYLAKQPLLFPSLGPSALLFFEKPTAPESSPYRAVVGHLVGILAGVAAIAVFGLLGAPSVLEAGVSLGLLGEPRQLAWVLAGVLLLTAASWALNRLAGVPVRLREG